MNNPKVPRQPCLVALLVFAALGVMQPSRPPPVTRSSPCPVGKASYHPRSTADTRPAGGNKHIHYWFIGSEGPDPAKAPVAVWMNGGPGCSSLDGLVYEHGPFRFDPADPSKLVRFNYTWAKRANVLYIEAPVGVGFSYSDDPADYNVTDDTTAQDNLHAIEQFYRLFPEFKTNDLFLTGESCE